MGHRKVRFPSPTRRSVRHMDGCGHHALKGVEELPDLLRVLQVVTGPASIRFVADEIRGPEPREIGTHSLHRALEPLAQF